MTAGKAMAKDSTGRLHVTVKSKGKRKLSSKLWLERQLNDPYVAQAKRDGYRSRAAYKLIEIDDKHHLLKPGMTVADLGTGVGYMLPWLSRAVSPGGAVIAEDIFPDFLDKARETARHESLKNVSFLLGTDRDTRLPAACCDLVMALDAYHHFDYPGDMLASVARGLKPGGRFAIIDYYRRPDAMPGGRAMDHIRLDRDDVIREVEGFGWKCTWRGDHNPKSQYIAIFENR
jgi:23S rRNA U2552 (ribose-2'-O)-methylase RlmE/FtsJ